MRFASLANPEFLREGVAVKDFMEPALVVVGGSDQDAVKRVASLYAGLKVQPCLVALRTAEMIKYACNAFHALKIEFANEIGSLAEVLGIQPEEVMENVVPRRQCIEHVGGIPEARIRLWWIVQRSEGIALSGGQSWI